jgi:hypothetical protein
MPSGGLLDLVAHGIQDVFLIGNPQITFFKSVYKRYTNFSIESILIPLTGDPDFGTRFSCTIPVKGDLLSGLFMEIDLPLITAKTVDSFGGSSSAYDVGRGTISWINNIGHGIIDHIDLKIGGQIIDTNYGEWMEIWTELTQEIGRKTGLDYMLARSANPGSDGPSPVIVSGPRTLIIPLQFWFCRNIGLALPLLALQYHAVELDFFFNPLSRCYTFGPNDYYYATGSIGAGTINLVNVNNNSADATTYNGRVLYGHNGESYYIHPTTAITGNGTNVSPYVIPLAPTTTLLSNYTNELIYISPNGDISAPVSLSDVRLYGDYIYLDTIERKEFAQNKHRYLIEQTQFRDSESIQANLTEQKFPIKFNLPVKELFWVLQRDDVFLTNDVFNFSNAVDPALVRGNILSSAYILFNGIERFAARNGDYFRLTIPYQRHTRVPNDFYYMYSFALNPEEHQPSGISNFSKINFIDLNISTFSGLPNIQLRVYGLSYNVLRIMNGMGSVAFGN